MFLSSRLSSFCRTSLSGLSCGFVAYFAMLAMLLAAPASAQNVSATVTTGGEPVAVAVNPITNKIYIANEGGASVTVIDGATNLTRTIPVGNSPLAVAVNTVTNKIYVANVQDSTVSVIDGTKEAVVATSGVGMTPAFVAVNPLTNRIYVCNIAADTVSVIDGGTDTVIATVIGPNSTALGLLGALAVNPATNKIYVVTIPNGGSSSVAVIDGSSNAIIGTVPVGDTSSVPFQTAIAVNPISNKIYVANSFDSTVSVIDGASDSVLATVTVRNFPSGFAVNPVTNKIYVTAQSSDSSNFVTVIDGVNDTAIVAVPMSTPSLGATVNVVTNQVYVMAAGLNPNSVTVINGATNATTTLTVGSTPASVAVNPITNKIYVANQGVIGNSGGGTTATVIDGATNAAAPVTTGNLPQSVAVNPVTGQAFVTNGSDDTVAVIQGADNSTTVVSVGTKPEAVAVNAVTGLAYVVNQGDGTNPSTMTVIDGNNLSVAASVPVGISPLNVVVNPVTNKIYVANSGSNSVMVVDGGSNAVMATIPVGVDPIGMAVNPVTNRIYVCNTSDGTLSMIDGATNTTTTIVLGPPPTIVASVAVNPVTNLIYVSYLLVQNGQSGVLLGIIDGSTNSLQVSIVLGVDTLPSPQLVVNPITNMVYIANSPNPGSLVVLNAGEGNILVGEVNIGQAPLGMALNPATNKIYVTDTASGNLTVIDGISNAAFAIPAGGPTGTVAVNPITGKIYAGHVASDISVISEQQVNPSPLAVQQISPASFTGVSTGDRNPVFELSASSSFQPFALPVANVLYQVDTWQGNWQSAAGLGTNFSAQLSNLALGTHILYAYATDGQDSSLYPGNSVTSTIGAYPFTVVQAGSSTALTTSVNPVAVGQNVTLTAVVSSTATGVPVPTGSINFMDGSTVLGTSTLDGTGTTTFATASLAAGPHEISLVYGGDVNFLASTSTVLTETVTTPATPPPPPPQPPIVLSFAQVSQTVTSGNSATYDFTVSASSTLSGPVSFACIGLPQGATCSFSPQTVSAGSSGTLVVLKVSTTAQSSAVWLDPLGQYVTIIPVLYGVLLGAPLLALLASRRRSRYLVLARTTVFASLLVLLMLLPGCGTNNNPSTVITNSNNTGTPSGTFSLAVTATSGQTQTISVVTLIVQ